MVARIYMLQGLRSAVQKPESMHLKHACAFWIRLYYFMNERGNSGYTLESGASSTSSAGRCILHSHLSRDARLSTLHSFDTCDGTSSAFLMVDHHDHGCILHSHSSRDGRHSALHSLDSCG